MNPKKQKANVLIDHFFRQEAGKLVATLTRIFGLQNIELAEDIVQDTLIAALDHWSTNEIPQNPAAWIMQVAKRKTINALNKNESIKRHAEQIQIIEKRNTETIDEIFLEKEIKDSQLRMIFTCAHPSLSLESQIALTLKTLCGFGINEIAKALFSTPSTINKRLYRAKQKIRAKQIEFNIPSGENLEKRLDSVCLTLYLLFNEGYNSSQSEALIRKDLCVEAIRLTKLLTAHFTKHPKLYALLALMCFHSARFDARLDKKGGIILYEEQDRGLWDFDLIAQGIRSLQKAATGEILTEYHLEAGIAAEHCMAKSYKETDWESIYKQYELLYRLKSNPIIKLNLAIIQSQLTDFETSLKALQQIEQGKELINYYLLPATQGIFNMKVRAFEKAIPYLKTAKMLTSSAQEKRFIEDQIQICVEEPRVRNKRKS